MEALDGLYKKNTKIRLPPPTSSALGRKYGGDSRSGEVFFDIRRDF